LDAATPTPSPEPPRRLKLRAVDTEDLAVLAAFLQDAIACVAEMAYLPDERRFVLVVCRFRWERLATDTLESVFERVSCAISIQDVDEPKYRGFDLKDRNKMMPILTVVYQDGAVIITFGGGAALRLGADRLDLRMEDFGLCWPTRAKPAHGADLS
jgi:hypothetical protein